MELSKNVKSTRSFIKKQELQMQKREYEKLAKQNLPKRLIKMQKKQVQYDAGNFFLFDLLGHPFMTSSLLTMFRGKSLFKMCLYLHKRCKMNFDSYNSDTKLEKLFNNPNLDQIRILDEQCLDPMSDESAGSLRSLLHDELSPDIKDTSPENKLKSKRRKTAHLLEGPRHSSLRQSANPVQSLGMYRDETGHKLLKKITLEENTLRTRIFFENEKLRKLLLKNDDIQELHLITNKMKTLQNKIYKSQIRNVFKKIFWTTELNICVSFCEDGHLFEVRDGDECHDLNYVRFSFEDDFVEPSDRSFMKMDDKREEVQYQRDMKEDHVGEYKVLLIPGKKTQGL